MLTALFLRALLARTAGGPIPGFEVAHGAGGCRVELLVRTSHPYVCWPSGTTAPTNPGGVGLSSAFFNAGHHLRDTFGCDDAASVTTGGACAGVFQCQNGGTILCGGRNVTCRCDGARIRGISEPCHHNAYARSKYSRMHAPCPPALPLPPIMPPRPPAPPLLPPRPSRPPAPPQLHQRCNRWCHVWFTHFDRRMYCHCAACRNWTALDAHALTNYTIDEEATGMLEAGAHCHMTQQPSDMTWRAHLEPINAPLTALAPAAPPPPSSRLAHAPPPAPPPALATPQVAAPGSGHESHASRAPTAACHSWCKPAIEARHARMCVCAACVVPPATTPRVPLGGPCH